MSIVKSLSVGEGDMFYINHNTSNFSIIDCCLSDENKKIIVDEIISESGGKDITRFISTHPDKDHIQQLEYLDGRIGILNFYCVQNEATKKDEVSGFERYCLLRDSDKKAYYVYRGCKRKWMNDNGKDNSGKDIYNSGINFLWPIITNEDYIAALEVAKQGGDPNNISPIFKYGSKGSATFLWMGDMLKEFMEKIEDVITPPEADILFAPHHGRKSSKIPKTWLDNIDPKIIVVGEASSNDLAYDGYGDYNKITQNSAKDITFHCEEGKVHIG